MYLPSYYFYMRFMLPGSRILINFDLKNKNA